MRSPPADSLVKRANKEAGQIDQNDRDRHLAKQRQVYSHRQHSRPKGRKEAKPGEAVVVAKAEKGRAKAKTAQPKLR